ncbi:crossover junction endodeoxyribonuclease RuvC [Candidatus Saccharibacteria bacterium]|nr:crossover junction endodeoxyribonuclease RuvC [Candidatus Saccharibacteria bacterium]
MRILGIDPGLGICGFGLIETSTRASARVLDYGAVTTRPGVPVPERLKELYESLLIVFNESKPDVVGIEKLFFSKNITTGIAVAEARGVILLVAAQKNVPIREYTPNQIKIALTGYGAANKTQMEEMVRVHLGLKQKPKPDDAADALATAITCGFLYREDDIIELDKFSNTGRY